MACRRFSQKTNQQVCFACFFVFHGKQNKFVCWFFGRIYGAPKLLCWPLHKLQNLQKKIRLWLLSPNNERKTDQICQKIRLIFCDLYIPKAHIFLHYHPYFCVPSFSQDIHNNKLNENKDYYQIKITYFRFYLTWTFEWKISW